MDVNTRRTVQATRGDMRPADAPDYFRMLKPDLKALGTPDALRELDRRKAKRTGKANRGLNGRESNE